MEGRWNHQFWKVLITVFPWIAARNPLVSLVQEIHAGFPTRKLRPIESRFGWIIWVIRKSGKQLASVIKISFAISQAEIRWRTGCISSFFFFSWGFGDFFSLLLYWNLYQFLVQVSKLIAMTIPGEDSVVFTAETVISLQCLFDSWEAVFTFILLKAKIWGFRFWFCPETSLLHSFIKALNTFEIIFLIKKQSFLVFCQTFFPEPPVPLAWAQHFQGILGARFSLQPRLLLGEKKQQAGPPLSWGHAGWWPSPCPATSVGCWCLAVWLRRCRPITCHPCFALPKGKGVHPRVCPDFQPG